MDHQPAASQFLDADDILGADDITYATVHVPEWRSRSGIEHVRIKCLTGAERGAFESSIVQQLPAGPRGGATGTKVDMRTFREKLVAASIVDGEGKRLFNDSHIAALGAKSAAALARVADAASKLSRISDEDTQEMVGNSNATVEVLWDGTNGYRQEVTVSSFSFDADPEGLQEYGFSLVPTGALPVVIGAGPIL